MNMTKITAEQRLWYANTTKRVLDYWTPENQNTMIERPRTCMAGGVYRGDKDTGLTCTKTKKKA